MGDGRKCPHMALTRSKSVLLVDVDGTARALARTLHAKVSLRTFGSGAELLAAVRGMSPAQLREVGGVVLEAHVPRYVNDVRLPTSHPDAFERGLPVAREVEALLRNRDNRTARVMLHVPAGLGFGAQADLGRVQLVRREEGAGALRAAAGPVSGVGGAGQCLGAYSPSVWAHAR